MTLRHYLQNLSQKVFAIEECFNGKYIQYHTSFTYDEDNEHYYLCGTGDNDTLEMLPLDQEIKIEGDSIVVQSLNGVTDTEETLVLTFFTATIIPHPKE